MVMARGILSRSNKVLGCGFIGEVWESCLRVRFSRDAVLFLKLGMVF